MSRKTIINKPVTQNDVAREAGVTRSMVSYVLNDTQGKSVASDTKQRILDAIAKHYGISSSEAFEEVTDPGAEHLLDYLTGSVRTATSVLMQRHGLR